MYTRNNDNQPRNTNHNRVRKKRIKNVIHTDNLLFSNVNRSITYYNR